MLLNSILAVILLLLIGVPGWIFVALIMASIETKTEDKDSD